MYCGEKKGKRHLRTRVFHLSSPRHDFHEASFPGYRTPNKQVSVKSCRDRKKKEYLSQNVCLIFRLLSLGWNLKSTRATACLTPTRS